MSTSEELAAVLEFEDEQEKLYPEEFHELEEAISQTVDIPNPPHFA